MNRFEQKSLSKPQHKKSLSGEKNTRLKILTIEKELVKLMGESSAYRPENWKDEL